MNYDPPHDDLDFTYQDMDIINEEMSNVFDSIMDNLDEYEKAALNQDIDTFAYLYRQRIQEAQYE